MAQVSENLASSADAGQWVDVIEWLKRCALLQLKVTDMLALSRLRSTGPRRKNGSARCSTAGVAKPNCFSALLDGLKGRPGALNLTTLLTKSSR